MGQRSNRTSQRRQRLTVLVPACNEAATVADTIRRLRTQSCPPDEIIVIDDCSADGTARVARDAGARVLRPPQHTGSKAGAQNFALPLVKTELVMAVDADTRLSADTLERLLAGFQQSQVGAACRFVLPARARTDWERSRYLEYLFAFTFYQRIPDNSGPALLEAGSFSLYRTAVLRRQGGWPTVAAAEDLELGWRLYQEVDGLRFLPPAVSFPIEPATFVLARKQQRSDESVWRQHWRRILRLPHLATAALPVVAAQAAIMGAVLLALFATGWLLGLMIGPEAGADGVSGAASLASGAGFAG